jgi:hypothetical protein
MNALAPVALFVYARPEHTRRVLQALRANSLAQQTELFIFSDAPKKPELSERVRLVREVISHEAHGFRKVSVVSREKNFGLARSIITGASDLLRQHGRLIVLEDDLVTSPHFLRFMNDCLGHFDQDKRIYSVSGFGHPSSAMPALTDYPHDVYLTVRNSSWGWATWADRWQNIDWDVKDYPRFKRNWLQRWRFNRGGDDMAEMLDMQMSGIIDSWAIRFSYAQFRAGAYSVTPKFSYVSNEGFDGSGMHCGAGQGQVIDLGLAKEKVCLPTTLNTDQKMLESFRQISKVPFQEKLKKHIKKNIKSLLVVFGFEPDRVKKLIGWNV